PKYLTVVGSYLFFSADDGLHGPELWRTNGTAAGTVLVTDLCAGASGSNPTSLAGLGATVYFAADNCVSGSQLYTATGAGAASMLKNLYDDGLGLYTTTSSNPQNITASN